MRCRAEVEAIRAEPDEAAEQVTQALRGEPLAVVEERGGWARIITSYDYPGWIRAGALEPGEGFVPPARSGDPVEEARAFLGAPYEWGGLTARGIDCSGLVHAAYRRLGAIVPRDAADQEGAAVEIGVDDLRRGDLVTYGTSGRCDHVAFWLGGGRILHATGRDGLGVVEEYEPKELKARRRRLVRLSVPSFQGFSGTKAAS
jgi:cell wall-associated NlpC family hydrolase